MTAYARVAVSRLNGFTRSNQVVSLAAIASFPAMTGGAGGDVTHFGLGTHATAGVAGQLIFFGTVTPNLAVVNGITPKLDTGTTFTQSVDGMTTDAGARLLDLIFLNTDWETVGDAAGLQNSAADGNFYLSLHTADPAEAGNQATSEIVYT